MSNKNIKPDHFTSLSISCDTRKGGKRERWASLKEQKRRAHEAWRVREKRRRERMAVAENAEEVPPPKHLKRIGYVIS